MPPEYCSHCGAEVPPRARACPECGSDERTGWSERAEADRLGIPDDEFDYEEYTRREFGGEAATPRRRWGWLWWLVALALVALFLSGMIL